MKTPIEKMIEEAGHIEWDAIYSMKGHFNAATCWNVAHYVLGLAAIIAAIGGQHLISDKGTVAFLSAGFAAVITFLKPAEKVAHHHRAGAAFGALRRDARIFCNIDSAMNDQAKAREELKQLAERVAVLNEESPAIPWPAYFITRRGVRGGEAQYDEPGERKA